MMEPHAQRARRGHRLALVLTGVAVGIAYAGLVRGWAEPSALGWRLVIVGTALELLLWYLLFRVGRTSAGPRV